MKKGKFCGSGDSLASMQKPGAKSIQKPSKAPMAKGGFKGEGGGSARWPGESNSLPKK